MATRLPPAMSEFERFHCFCGFLVRYFHMENDTSILYRVTWPRFADCFARLFGFLAFYFDLMIAPVYYLSISRHQRRLTMKICIFATTIAAAYENMISDLATSGSYIYSRALC